MKSWEDNAQTWKTMPLSSSLFFFAGVFCLFGALLLVATNASFQSQSAADVLLTVVVAGVFAILFAYAATIRQYWLFAVLFPLQMVVNVFLARIRPGHHSLESNLPELKHKLVVAVSVEFVLIIAATSRCLAAQFPAARSEATCLTLSRAMAPGTPT